MNAFKGDFFGFIDVESVVLHQVLDSGQRVVNVFLLIVLLKEQVLQASVDLGLGHGGALGLAI